MTMNNASLHVYRLNWCSGSMDTQPHKTHLCYTDYLSKRCSHIHIFISLFISAFIGFTFFLFVSSVLRGGEGEHSFLKNVINLKQASPSHPPSASIPSVITHHPNESQIIKMQLISETYFLFLLSVFRSFSRVRVKLKFKLKCYTH